MNMFRVGLIETLPFHRCRLRAAGGKGSFATAGLSASAQTCRSAGCQPRPCLLCSSRTVENGPANRGEIKITKKGGRRSAGKGMEKRKLEDLRDRVPCAVVLEQAGFAVDVKESTRRAVKYRRGAEIIIVIHQGRGWFDPLSDAKGDVFNLAAHLDGLSFVESLNQVAALVGFVANEPVWSRTVRDPAPSDTIPERWAKRRKPWRGSMTWRYLQVERRLSETIIRAAIRDDVLREGPQGSMWAAHVNEHGAISGWEERGPDWRGFSTGGSKVLFRLGAIDALRLCVTEAAIDAMSLAAFEGLREGSLYLSTGGGWSPSTDAAVRKLAARAGIQLVAATDANIQGETFASRLRDIADEAGCDWLRLTPPDEDWNDALCAREKEKQEKQNEGRRGLPHARRPRQG
ncbi:conserved hypothetical protein (plasmid) [Allorhizobium ampelinum S4]|uniref:DUF3991 domain-containing protein n=2 Tax=Rhizobium/Agrobacterium group TaxID=227290 RepID=B9K4D2_ALLAM|nr:conserved hypothetical protein [Allorhizobium ampelinum S4]